MAFFRENKARFTLEPQDGRGLRTCQLGAVWALKSHFTANSNEIAALVSMPTGSGKTALMMAACFELQIGKVLIVVPSKILRRQICEQFRSLQVLRDAGCLTAACPGARVYEVEKRQSSRKAWIDILQNHDVIVAHPNSISPYYQNLYPLPAELIDAVFMDEAHHEPAPTWKAINDYYASLKRVFFTATPFRRDRKRMKAKLAYHYSITRALDEGILRAVDFRGVAAGLHERSIDGRLIEAAREVFRREREQNANAALLIRTDRIELATELAVCYNEAGLLVDVIHSQRSANVNARLVQKTREGILDGLVCVGIASEGLDIPNLKIAVLHATPRSIPYTIQFLGRISRQPLEQSGPATLIANQDEVRGEVGRLYRTDESWSRLIPAVVDHRLSGARLYRSARIRESDFQMPELNVFFSALVYETEPGFRFEEGFELLTKPPFEVVHVEQAAEDAPLMVITSFSKPLEWANGEIYVDDMLDLHLFYRPADTHLLFELTTGLAALESFKEALIKSRLRPLAADRLYRTLSGFDQSDYIMVGMKNGVLHGAAQPTYKTFMGHSVQASVRASEGRAFYAGHALLRLDEDHVWGLATRHGRVWAMQRGSIEEFKGWCDQLSDLILNGPVVASLPGLSFLATARPVSRIHELPVAVIPDDLFFRAYRTIIDVPGRPPYRNIIPFIEAESLDEETGVLHCRLRIEDYECDLWMDLQADPVWHTDGADIRVRADKNEKDEVHGSLDKILNDYPPSLVMPDGSVVEGRNRITPNRTIERLPDGIWRRKDWTNCDIRSEAYDENPPPGRLPVINQTVALIRPEFDLERDVLVLDDGSHEVADLVWFQERGRMIHLIHCKASKDAAPGCRKGDCDILFAQAMRSIHWVAASSLVTRLEERFGPKRKIVLGSRRRFEEIKKNYRIRQWRYNIVLVQPGFNILQVSDRERANNNVYELAIPMYERITAGLAEMEIWGS